MKANPYIPDIFVIGAMKAGTSTLFHNILDHPAIQRTKEKEANIFLRNESTDRLAELYKSQFPGVDRGKNRCDVSPMYSRRQQYPHVAERIYQANAEARIIYITRDPIDRIVSHLHHNLLRGRFKGKEADREVLSNAEYLLSSKYGYQLAAYTELFPLDQILVLTLEELNLEPAAFCNKVALFLGIDGIQYSQKKFNVSDTRYQILRYDSAIRYLKSNTILKMYKYFWYLLNITPRKPALSSETLLTLKSKLKDDCDSFVGQFAIDVRLWKNFQ